MKQGVDQTGVDEPGCHRCGRVKNAKMFNQQTKLFMHELFVFTIVNISVCC